MPKMNARMMRTKMALEVAAELYNRRMFTMGNVATIAIQPSSREEPFPGLTMGINGNLMGGMKAPIEVGYGICAAIDARQNVIVVDDDQPLDMKNICRGTESAPLEVPLHPGAKKYYEEKGYL